VIKGGSQLLKVGAGKKNEPRSTRRALSKL
jgi:hypothetical protein